MVVGILVHGNTVVNLAGLAALGAVEVLLLILLAHRVWTRWGEPAALEPARAPSR
jgi:hypothetical protein